MAIDEIFQLQSVVDLELLFELSVAYSSHPVDGYVSTEYVARYAVVVVVADKQLGDFAMAIDRFAADVAAVDDLECDSFAGFVPQYQRLSVCSQFVFAVVLVLLELRLQIDCKASAATVETA